MAAVPSAATDSERRPSLSGASIRGSLRQARGSIVSIPGSPHTPQQQRPILSPYTGTSSPGSSFRQEEDAAVLEIGSRWLRAGFEGNSMPTCVTGFGTEEGRRVGDYRGWIRNNNRTVRKRLTYDVETWSKNYELWTSDLRGFDIQLFEDRIERAIREVYNKYLLTDAGSSRLVLVIPSIVPHPLLASLLSTIFHRWKYPSITLLPTAAMATVSAGLRSSLVVDIGWEETVVTAVYEYREIRSKRSTRAMKMMMYEMGKMLSSVVYDIEGSSSRGKEGSICIPFELCEEILVRLAWCEKSSQNNEDSEFMSAHSAPSTVSDGGNRDTYSRSLDSKVSIPLPVGSDSKYTEIPFSQFSQPTETTLFGGLYETRDWDDEDMPLDILIYYFLLSLPPDLRGTCMSRIVFTGGGANIPGVRQRILDDVNALIEKNQWSVSRGKFLNKRKSRLYEQSQNANFTPSTTDEPNPTFREPPELESNFIDEKMDLKRKDDRHVHGVLRQVESMGPWTGASLLASLKVRGMVEVEREKYLQHGLAGANRDYELNPPDRRSGHGPGAARAGGDRSSWTLGEWR
ncbi:hypothetical protein MGYG_01312 [Nannizzia gypsea CBS 118893]|uniref:Actin-related protein RO7 n=1 Tax=Arthroderma gypseum (strain ATCC MYA-4604 / CBS 118893) TaxID=535722 RepID=E5R030_ARTGP|nr:hypothetical protein MGYG_01312 [Nannizzia gypsea CBS 118893]EFQ98279.1 hypothetical protein MGYG_01312 [Nannizzia gypsea CBS 118893]